MVTQQRTDAHKSHQPLSGTLACFVVWAEAVPQRGGNKITRNHRKETQTEQGKPKYGLRSCGFESGCVSSLHYGTGKTVFSSHVVEEDSLYAGAMV